MSEDEDFLDHDGFHDDDDDDDNMDDVYLTFTLEQGEYAISVANVKEIVRLPEFREVPDVPDFIRGVINLRGRVVPLMDARVRLGLPDPDYSDRTVVIVLEADGAPTGLVADGVNGVRDFPPETIEANTHGGGGKVRAVVGIGRHHDTIAIILDANRLLGESDIDKESIAELVQPEGAPAQHA